MLTDRIKKDFFIESNHIDKLEEYVRILLFWQKKMNLISNNSIQNIWERHIIDSLQLIKFIKNKEHLKIADLGSGAGLPSIVLAIIDPLNFYYPIESSGKKVAFLNEVSKKLQLKNINIIHSRIEDIKDKNAYFDLIISRAMAKLSLLVKLSRPIIKATGQALFLKGKSYKEELDVLYKDQENHNISHETFDSVGEGEGKIIIINYLR